MPSSADIVATSRNLSASDSASLGPKPNRSASRVARCGKHHVVRRSPKPSRNARRLARCWRSGDPLALPALCSAAARIRRQRRIVAAPGAERGGGLTASSNASPRHQFLARAIDGSIARRPARRNLLGLLRRHEHVGFAARQHAETLRFTRFGPHLRAALRRAVGLDNEVRHLAALDLSGAQRGGRFGAHFGAALRRLEFRRVPVRRFLRDGSGREADAGDEAGENGVQLGHDHLLEWGEGLVTSVHCTWMRLPHRFGE